VVYHLEIVERESRTTSSAVDRNRETGCSLGEWQLTSLRYQERSERSLSSLAFVLRRSL